MKRKEIYNKVDSLYNMGTGSHDTINNKRVCMSSWWIGDFTVDGVKTNGVIETCIEVMK